MNVVVHRLFQISLAFAISDLFAGEVDDNAKWMKYAGEVIVELNARDAQKEFEVRRANGSVGFISIGSPSYGFSLPGLSQRQVREVEARKLKISNEFSDDPAPIWATDEYWKAAEKFVAAYNRLAYEYYFQENGAESFGVGAYPLSDRTVSMWILGKNTHGSPKGELLVYFKGEPGWHNRGWKSSFSGNTKNRESVEYKLTSDTYKLSIMILPDRANVEVQGRRFELASGNVFIVDVFKQGEHEAAVTQVEFIDLTIEGQKPLSLSALDRSKKLKLMIQKSSY